MKKNRRNKLRRSAVRQPKEELTTGAPEAGLHPPLPCQTEPPVSGIRAALGDRLIVFVGMMAAGKTSVGRMVAHNLSIPFVDADHEIEAAAQMSVPEIFAQRGEAEFRGGERRVIARLLRDGPRVLATGGGAYMAPETREAIKARGISVWLKVDPDTILRRARKRNNRPLLQTADPDATVRELVRVRYPVYGQADLTIESDNLTHEQTTALVLSRLATFLLSSRDVPALAAETARLEA